MCAWLIPCFKFKLLRGQILRKVMKMKLRQRKSFAVSTEAAHQMTSLYFRIRTKLTFNINK